MATLEIASKEALLSKNITPLSELWVTRIGPNTGRNMIARATDSNADFEKGFVGQNGAKGWVPIDSGYNVTDKYRCFGARCIEISGSSGPYGLETASTDPLGIEVGDPLSLSIYYNVIVHNSGSFKLTVYGDAGVWVEVASLEFGTEVTDGWKRATLSTVSPGSYLELKFAIESDSFSGKILIDRPQVEASVNINSFHNGREYTDKAPVVQGYTVDIDRNFGSNTMVIECANPGGNYSYDKISPQNTIEGQHYPFFDFMNRVVLKEGIVDSNGGEEWWTKFTGYIDGQTPSNTGDGPGLQIQCTDRIKDLSIDHIDHTFEPEKIFVSEEVLTPQDPDDRIIFESEYQNWAKTPPVAVYVDDELQHQNDYTIDYARGHVYFNYARDPEEVVKVSFYYYEAGTNMFGEVIRRVCRSRGIDVGSAFDQDDNYVLGGAENRDKSIDPAWAGDVLLDFYDQRIDEYIEPQVPPTMMAVEEQINYYEALNKIREGIIAPNFILKANAHGQIVGFYSFQKQTHDHELILPQSIDIPIDDSDIYTRVLVYGRSSENQGLMRFATVEKVQSSSYENGTVDNIKDGSPDTQFVQHWGDHKDYKPPVSMKKKKEGEPVEPFPFIIVDFGKNVSEIIQENYDIYNYEGVAQIQFEGCSPVNSEILSAGRVGTDSMEFTLKYRMDGEEEWKDIHESTRRFGIGKNQIVSFDQSVLGKNFDFRYLRLDAERLSYYVADASAKKGSTKWDAWCIGIANMQVWPENRLLGEAKASQELIDRLGIRTYVVPEDPMLDTKEKVQNLAELILREVSRNLRRVSVTLVYAPYLELGDTVLVEDPIHGVSRLFYIESIRHSRSGIVPTVEVGMTSYD